ncbi:MAG: 4Fe-4S binding protein, partial [Coriobacteriales bacterium]
MPINYLLPTYLVERDTNRCIKCGACARQCSNETHYKDEDLDIMCVHE